MSENEMASDAVALQRDSNGKLHGGVTGKGFRPGHSGNPSGKRKGTVSLAAALARSLTRQDARAICRKLISLAKDGDVPALKLLFDRLDTVDIEQRIFELEQKLEQQPPTPKNEKAPLPQTASPHSGRLAPAHRRQGNPIFLHALWRSKSQPRNFAGTKGASEQRHVPVSYTHLRAHE